MPEFMRFLASLLEQQQDNDTVNMVAHDVWFPGEEDKATQVSFTKTDSGVLAKVVLVNTETWETISEEHWRIEARRV